MRRSTWFTAAVGAIALHVVDDSFLQPQPGTSAGDHIFSGLIPLVILALAAWAYPRVRAGAGAAIALSLVIPAILSGVEAIYYGSRTGLSGDDYSGLLALAAAPILLWVGISGLWSSRRMDDSRTRRYGRRLLKSAGVFVAAAVVVVPLAAAYISAHAARAEVPVAKLGTAHENVKLHTSDGLELDGWYVPSTNGAAVIVFPGRGGTREEARMLARNGYGVLLYDRRGEGRSEGDPDGWGWDFDKDIRAGVDFLKHRADVAPGKIGGLGLSVGGEMMIETAAKTEDLAAIVSEGAGSRSMREELDDVSGFAKITTGVTYGLRDLANSVLQNRLPPDNLENLIGKISPRPVFLIHAGEHDVGGRNPELYHAANEPKQIWEARGSHTGGISTQPVEYERRVVEFFDEALGVDDVRHAG